MDIRYAPDAKFRAAVKEAKAQLENIDGHMRWVVHPEDAEAYILRPESTRPSTTPNAE